MKRDLGASSDDFHSNYYKSMLARYFLSSTAAAIAETVTYPLDIVKTRLQLQGEMLKNDSAHKTKADGMFKTAINMGIFLIIS